MQEMMHYTALGALILFVVAECAEYRRRHRRDVDAVGFMPWRGIALVSLAGALLAGALILKAALA